MEINDYKYELYRFSDYIMSTAFSAPSINIGVRNALFVTKIFTESNDVLLYRKNDKNEYDLCLNALMVKNNYKNDNNWINTFVNNITNSFEDNEVKNIICSGIDNEFLTLIPFVIDNRSYLVVLRGCDFIEDKKYEMFYDKFTKVMHIILHKLEEYNKLQEKGFKDELTHINNRNSYENDIIELDNHSDEYIYVLLDLFRLKYVNDNYDYAHGDAYIVNAAKILEKYFPKYYNFKDNHGISIEAPTGSCVYRIGGDEFVIITKREKLDDVNNKLSCIREEVANIDLGVEENLHLGINYGIGIREQNEKVKQIAIIAGNELKKDKEAMYSKLGIERRKQLIKTK